MTRMVSLVRVGCEAVAEWILLQWPIGEGICQPKLI